MSLEAAIVIGLALVLGPLLPALLARWQRPGFLMTVQKHVNVTTPEVVTIQTNLPADALPSDVWLAVEKAGLAATARMQSINDEVLEVMQAETDQIAAKRAKREREKAALSAARHAKKRTRLGRDFVAPVLAAPPRPDGGPPDAA